MDVSRIYRKTERSATEQSEIEQVRNAPKDGATTGEKVGSQDYNAIIKLISQLKARREELGLSQIELAERMGIKASALCRLEMFKVVNPSAWTLLHWAKTLGNELNLELRNHTPNHEAGVRVKSPFTTDRENSASAPSQTRPSSSE